MRRNHANNGRDRVTSAETPRHRAARADGPDLLMNVIRALDKTLKETRSDYGQLTSVERHVKRVDVFDSYSTNDGFDGFFANVPLPEAWQETEEALEAVGAAPLAEVLRRARAAYVAAEKLEDEDERNQAFLALDGFKREMRRLGIDLEEVLRQYVDRNYPWSD